MSHHPPATPRQGAPRGPVPGRGVPPTPRTAGVAMVRYPPQYEYNYPYGGAPMAPGYHLASYGTYAPGMEIHPGHSSEYDNDQPLTMPPQPSFAAAPAETEEDAQRRRAAADPQKVTDVYNANGIPPEVIDFVTSGAEAMTTFAKLHLNLDKNSANKTIQVYKSGQEKASLVVDSLERDVRDARSDELLRIQQLEAALAAARKDYAEGQPAFDRKVAFYQEAAVGLRKMQQLLAEKYLLLHGRSDAPDSVMPEFVEALFAKIQDFSPRLLFDVDPSHVRSGLHLSQRGLDRMSHHELLDILCVMNDFSWRKNKHVDALITELVSNNFLTKTFAKYNEIYCYRRYGKASMLILLEIYLGMKEVIAEKYRGLQFIGPARDNVPILQALPDATGAASLDSSGSVASVPEQQTQVPEKSNAGFPEQQTRVPENSLRPSHEADFPEQQQAAGGNTTAAFGNAPSTSEATFSFGNAGAAGTAAPGTGPPASDRFFGNDSFRNAAASPTLQLSAAPAPVVGIVGKASAPAFGSAPAPLFVGNDLPSVKQKIEHVEVLDIKDIFPEKPENYDLATVRSIFDKVKEHAGEDAIVNIEPAKLAEALYLDEETVGSLKMDWGALTSILSVMEENVYHQNKYLDQLLMPIEQEKGIALPRDSIVCDPIDADWAHLLVNAYLGNNVESESETSESAEDETLELAQDDVSEDNPAPAAATVGNNQLGTKGSGSTLKPAPPASSATVGNNQFGTKGSDSTLKPAPPASFAKEKVALGGDSEPPKCNWEFTDFGIHRVPPALAARAHQPQVPVMVAAAPVAPLEMHKLFPQPPKVYDKESIQSVFAKLKEHGGDKVFINLNPVELAEALHLHAHDVFTMEKDPLTHILGAMEENGWRQNNAIDSVVKKLQELNYLPMNFPTDRVICAPTTVEEAWVLVLIYLGMEETVSACFEHGGNKKVRYVCQPRDDGPFVLREAPASLPVTQGPPLVPTATSHTSTSAVPKETAKRAPAGQKQPAAATATHTISDIEHDGRTPFGSNAGNTIVPTELVGGRQPAGSKGEKPSAPTPGTRSSRRGQKPVVRYGM